MSEPPQGPPPGFYPDQSGVSRYWNGSEWTDQNEPRATPEPVPTQTPSKGKSVDSSHNDSAGPWFKRKRFVISAAALVLLFVAGFLVFGNDASEPNKSPASVKAVYSDNDSVPDSRDAFPDDPTEFLDQDGNGVGDHADADAALAAQNQKEADERKKEADERKKTIANAQFVSKRTLALVFKDPDSQQGKIFKVWGEITQFDAATGTDSFLADAAHTNTTSYGYFEGENALFTGSEAALSKFVEDDLFVATVEVTGSLSYDTQLGGNTTVPQFQVLKISRP